MNLSCAELRQQLQVEDIVEVV